jgi:hypothetical protein
MVVQAVIPAFRRLRQEDREFKTSLEYSKTLSQKQTNNKNDVQYPLSFKKFFLKSQ